MRTSGRERSPDSVTGTCDGRNRTTRLAALSSAGCMTGSLPPITPLLAANADASVCRVCCDCLAARGVTVRLDPRRARSLQCGRGSLGSGLDSRQCAVPIRCHTRKCELSAVAAASPSDAGTATQGQRPRPDYQPSDPEPRSVTNSAAQLGRGHLPRRLRLHHRVLRDGARIPLCRLPTAARPIPPGSRSTPPPATASKTPCCAPDSPAGTPQETLHTARAINLTELGSHPGPLPDLPDASPGRECRDTARRAHGASTARRLPPEAARGESRLSTGSQKRRRRRDRGRAGSLEVRGSDPADRPHTLATRRYSSRTSPRIRQQKAARQKTPFWRSVRDHTGQVASRTERRVGVRLSRALCTSVIPSAARQAGGQSVCLCIHRDRRELPLLPR